MCVCVCVCVCHHLNVFPSSSVDSVTITGDLGAIKTINLSRNEYGVNPSWEVAKVSFNESIRILVLSTMFI